MKFLIKRLPISTIILWLIPFICINVTYGQLVEEKAIQAHKMDKKELIVLDGLIEEDFWLKIAPTSDLRMQIPVEGELPSEQSEIRIAYDENNLYIAISFFDSDASQIKASQKKRDASLLTDDRFQWILDTFNDGRNAYYFAINPLGAMMDGLLTIGQGSFLRLNWDGIWRAWTKVHANGWSAEIRIPFRSLNFDPTADSWGINFQRTVRRKNEELIWAGHLRSQGLLRPQNAGKLYGLSGISQGLGLELNPYAAGRRTTLNENGEINAEFSGDLGFDVNYNINPRLKASFTYNTDFAETEVDSRQINLTRFPLLFPEKRDFFLEGANTYSFAPASGVRPYFSRRIGLSSGNTIPITAGVRLLGNVGKNNIALQHVRTGELGEIRPEDFTLARIKRNIGKESRLGFVYTRRSTQNGESLPNPLQDRHTVGADLDLSTSTFAGNKNLQFQAFFVYHNPESPLGESSFMDRTSRGIRLNFPNNPWTAHASYREFGVAFDPAMGFQSRVGFRRFQPSFAYNPLIKKSKLIRDIKYGLRFEHLMGMDWELLTQDIQFELFDITFESQDRIAFTIAREFERLTNDFDILRDGSIVIPLGNYPTWEVDIEATTATYRKFVVRLDLNSGGFWSGNRTTTAVSLTGRPVPGINMTGSFIHQDVNLAQGDFKTNLFRLNLSFDLSPWVSLNSFIQWDNLSNDLGINNRFRWIVSPGNEFLIVYTHNWQEQLERWTTLNNTATMKAIYTHRF